MQMNELQLGLEEFGLEKIRDGAEIAPGIRIENASQEQLALYAYRTDLVRKQLEEHLKVIKSNAHEVKLEIARKIQDLGSSSFEQFMPDGTKVSFKLNINDHVSIRKGFEEQAFLWLFSQNMGGIVKEYVHPASLKAQVTAYMKRDAELEDDEFNDEEIPSWVDLSDPESAEAWEDYKESKKYLNISAEEEISKRLEHYKEMQNKVRQVPLSFEPPEDAFSRYTEISTKLTYRRN